MKKNCASSYPNLHTKIFPYAFARPDNVGNYPESYLLPYRIQNEVFQHDGGLHKLSFAKFQQNSMSAVSSFRKISGLLPVLRIRDVYPGSWFRPSRIPDIGSWIQKHQQKRGVKKNCCPTFFCSHKYHKIVNILFFEQWRKKYAVLILSIS